MATEVRYRVVGNQYGHISIWPVSRADVLGWVDAGFAGTKQECLDHIDQHVGELVARVATMFGALPADHSR
ncbi:MbtH family NRPS accessory protein [Amycolatopsis mediterranei]|uniref:MbtH family NRPS accessory protein n=1 Tax=Amycolatopsis mediterranei TaxID=33910 RepID=UPI00343144C7